MARPALGRAPGAGGCWVPWVPPTRLCRCRGCLACPSVGFKAGGTILGRRGSGSSRRGSCQRHAHKRWQCGVQEGVRRCACVLPHTHLHAPAPTPQNRRSCARRLHSRWQHLSTGGKAAGSGGVGWRWGAAHRQAGGSLAPFCPACPASAALISPDATARWLVGAAGLSKVTRAQPWPPHPARPSSRSWQPPPCYSCSAPPAGGVEG